MTFRALKKFLLGGMRMQHIYQPVMVKALLARKGKCSPREIAAEILVRDESQLEYYERIVKSMPARVLGRHGIVSKEDKDYALVDFEALNKEQIHELRAICDQQIEDYEKRRGKLVWDHRRVSTGYVPGTIRFEVLKRSQRHCEACGISGDERALEVDHIIPRSLDGIDAIENFQALCYVCNASKSNRDTTDLRRVRESYEIRDANCIFCNLTNDREIFGENSLAIAFKDSFPVSELHTLVIPRRHVRDFFELGQAEINACTQLLSQSRELVQKRDPTVAGFNIGINVDEAGGQSVFHCHIHLIPRRPGDVPNPRGGVRHIIPGKGNY